MWPGLSLGSNQQALCHIISPTLTPLPDASSDSSLLVWTKDSCQVTPKHLQQLTLLLLAENPVSLLDLCEEVCVCFHAQRGPQVKGTPTDGDLVVWRKSLERCE